jgi:hypothetical protein
MTEKIIKCEFCGDERTQGYANRYCMYFAPNEYPKYFKEAKYLCVYCVRYITAKAENHRWDGV